VYVGQPPRNHTVEIVCAKFYFFTRSNWTRKIYPSLVLRSGPNRYDYENLPTRWADIWTSDVERSILIQCPPSRELLLQYSISISDAAMSWNIAINMCPPSTLLIRSFRVEKTGPGPWTAIDFLSFESDDFVIRTSSYPRVYKHNDLWVSK